MDEDRETRQFLIKHLITNIRCAVCSQRYELDDVRVLGRQDDLWIIGVACGQCHTQGLVFAVVREGKAEVVSELTPDEMERFEDARPVGIDDVLDVHRLLKDFQGDIKELFKK